MSNNLWSMFLLLVLVFASPSDAQNRKEITVEQIAEGVLALNRDMRENNARLERHEMRERQLGEHLKKTIAALDKQIKQQQSSINSLTETTNRILVSLDQREERERVQMQHLQANVDTVRSTLSTMAASNAGRFGEELRLIRERLELLTLTESNNGASDLIVASKILQEAANKLVHGETKLEDHATMAKGILEHFRHEVDRLKDFKKGKKDDYEADDETTLGTVLDSVETTQRMITDMEKRVLQGGGVSSNSGDSTGAGTNATLGAIAALREDLLRSAKDASSRIVGSIDTARAEASSGLSGLNVVLSEVKIDTTKSVEALRGLEKMAVQTADGVEEAKRKIELSNQQTLFQIRSSIKDNADYVDETVTEKFNEMANHILANQTTTLRNMSSVLESEISQVWRQIGIMYSQLTQSVSTLDRLQSQTETYVNGSLTTMDNMSGKVGQLSGSMAEVDGNLNYLLGRIGLVTKEFNQIKKELGTVLDQARDDFARLHSAVSAHLPDKQKIPDPIEDNLVGDK